MASYLLAPISHFIFTNIITGSFAWFFFLILSAIPGLSI